MMARLSIWRRKRRASSMRKRTADILLLSMIMMPLLSINTKLKIYNPPNISLTHRPPLHQFNEKLFVSQVISPTSSSSYFNSLLHTCIIYELDQVIGHCESFKNSTFIFGLSAIKTCVRISVLPSCSLFTLKLRSPPS